MRFFTIDDPFRVGIDFKKNDSWTLNKHESFIKVVFFKLAITL